jgi:hypothetical protein
MRGAPWCTVSIRCTLQAYADGAAQAVSIRLQTVHLKLNAASAPRSASVCDGAPQAERCKLTVQLKLKCAVHLKLKALQAYAEIWRRMVTNADGCEGGTRK